MTGYKVFAGASFLGHRKSLAAARKMARTAANRYGSADIYTAGGGMFGQGKKVAHVSSKKKNPSKRRLTAAPIMKVAREAGARKVRVMRSKSGKPTGIKFLR